MPDVDEHVVGDGALVLVWLVLFAVALRSLRRLRRAKGPLADDGPWYRRRTLSPGLYHQIYLRLIVWLSGGRAVSFALEMAMSLDVDVPGAVYLSAVILAGYFFFASFTLLIYFWAEIVYFGAGDGRHTARPLRACLLVNSLVLLSLVGVLALYPVLGEDETRKLALLIDAGANLLAAVGFVGYGAAVMRKVRNFTERKRGLLAKVALMTVLTSVAFVARALFLAGEGLGIVCKGTSACDDDFVLIFVFEAVAEILPTALMLEFLRRKMVHQRSLKQIQQVSGPAGGALLGSGDDQSGDDGSDDEEWAPAPILVASPG